MRLPSDAGIMLPTLGSYVNLPSIEVLASSAMAEHDMRCINTLQTPMGTLYSNNALSLGSQVLQQLRQAFAHPISCIES